MKILIVGSGGREHALAWKVAQSPLVSRVFVAPGNAGTSLEPRLTNVEIEAEDIAALVQFAKTQAIGLTIIGPEAPLVLGIVDAFDEAGLRCLGPSKDAAVLEGSKVFAKEFLRRHQIPTADYATFTAIPAALRYIRQATMPLVIKADGLAAGKGVVIATDQITAERAIQTMLSGQRFGIAGQQIVIEEFLTGEEVSFIALVDGSNILPLASSQDHKAVGDADTGPNTGGMGAYSPAPVLTPALHTKIMQEIMLPVVRGMQAEGKPYCGFLYAGLMIGVDGIAKVLEFNCRGGDPETQPIMLRLRSDLVTLCLATINGNLDQTTAEWDRRAALGVVLTAGGYPGRYVRGLPITGLPTEDAADSKIFHAGTALQNNSLVTNGGRVLCVTTLGANVTEAQQRAYALAKTIHWPDIYYRHDIGHRAIARELIAI